MLFLRSLAFNISFVVFTAGVSVLFYPLSIFNHSMAITVGRVWACGVIFLLRLLCNITYEVRGEKNLPKEPFIVASKHQSAWDTAIFLILLNNPAYVLKKELLAIPFFGRYLIWLKMVAINRDGGAKSLKGMLSDVHGVIKNNRSIVIFPEGTRTKFGQIPSYHPGIAYLYLDKEIDIPVIPVALNSGKFWHRDDFIRSPGKIILEYLPPVEKGLNRKDFMKRLESDIEKATGKL